MSIVFTDFVKELDAEIGRRERAGIDASSMEDLRERRGVVKGMKIARDMLRDHVKSLKQGDDNDY